MNDVYRDLADTSEEKKQQFKMFKRVVYESTYLRVQPFVYISVTVSAFSRSIFSLQ